ncbi:MAG: amidohydrolase family protein [Acidimicrobiales bacterium]|jgi:predicted amidohydrolase YtcJ
MPGLLLVGVAVGGNRLDVRCAGGTITGIGSGLVARRGETVVRGATTVLPGLHDHHLHLMAMAARSGSVDVGGVTGTRELARTLGDASARLPAGAWLRAVGYHETTGGTLDRRALDAMVTDRPVRVQHRSGHQWILNSPACRALGLEHESDPGLERDDAGDLTGRLLDRDDWIAERLPRGDPPDLGAVGRRLASYGVTGVTDATPTRTGADLEVLAGARRTGTLRQRVRVMGTVEDGAAVPGELEPGPVKVMVSDGADPDVDGLAGRIEGAHGSGRPVALHAVTRVAAALALAAWDRAGSRSGDRLEHGAVLAPDVVDRLAGLGVTVVTQPSFVAERGDEYLAEVEPGDVPYLYPCAGLDRAGVGLGGGTDAPFGPEDPWTAVAAAVRRVTRTGHVLGPAERLDPGRALGLFLSDPPSPGGPARTVRVGGPADLCLLDGDLRLVLEDPSSAHVVATVIDGELVHQR